VVTTKKSSATPCQQLATNCQPCQSADATECYNFNWNLNTGLFAGTNKPRDSGTSEGLCPADGGTFFIISGCGTINTASGQGGSSAGASGGDGSSGDGSRGLPPGGGDASNLANIARELLREEQNAWKVLDHIDSKGSPLPGYKGGGIFGNTGTGGGQVLPEFDSAGNQITYREWDVNPYVKGVNRGAQRIVTGSDGSAYYTSDHYQTFTRLR
jgi:guanyl-specific ribonuclease Sa